MSADVSDRTDEEGDEQQLETSEIGEKAGGGLGEEKRQKLACASDVAAINNNNYMQLISRCMQFLITLSCCRCAHQSHVIVSAIKKLMSILNMVVNSLCINVYAYVVARCMHACFLIVNKVSLQPLFSPKYNVSDYLSSD